MAAYNKFNVYTQDLASGVHNYATATFKFLLTNSAPVATNTVIANITDISAGNGYTAGGLTTTITLSNSSGTEKAVASAVTLTSNTGSVGPFRYVVFYNSTASGGPLISWFDYGSSITLNGANGDQFVITPDATNGIWQMT